MTQEGSKTLVIVGVVLGVIMGLGCLLGGAFLFFGVRMSSAASTPVSVPVVAPAAPVLSVVIDKAGNVFVDGSPVPAAELAKELGQQHSALGDARVSIAADRAVPYEKVVGVMDALKSAGFTKLALQVQPAEGG